MSKFNRKTAQLNKTVNFAGGEAFVESSKVELISLLLTSFVADQFYRKENETTERLAQLISEIRDKSFVAKAAIYARTQFGMRSISHVAAAEIAKQVKGEQWTKNFFDKIVYRPDDMSEILARYYQGAKNEPHALRKGFARALARFDEYALAKYKKEGSEISLVDIVNLVHPPHTTAIAKLVKGELTAPDTWEHKLTEAGKEADGDEDKKAELKKDVWESLIKTKKLGYFALLRNLRNILEQAPTLVMEACTMLTNRDLIKKSLVLPFRFTTAIDEIQQVTGVDTAKVREVIVALNQALDISVDNVPHFDGDTLVVLDESGSMNGRPFQIGSLFAAILVKSNNADFMGFSNDAHYRNLNPLDSTLTIQQVIDANRINGGTNFHAIFAEANKAYKRIIILSDMQGWIGYDNPTREFNTYKSRVGADPFVYSFDLAGYGTLQFPERNIYCLAGFSDKVFAVMKLLEQDKQALINEIEKVIL